jgi:glycosyltransferase involved in cell wall biosynthesis
VEIALTAEGTYPHQFGGVSVWCDQLVRGLPEHKFQLIALVATGSEPVRWSLPGNVTELTAVPLWGTPPPAPRGSRWLRPRSGPPVRELIDVLLAPAEEGREQFAQVLRELHAFSRHGNLSAELGSEQSVRLLSEAWRERWPADDDRAPPTLHDAVMAIQLLEHALRPLSHPAPRADVVHAVTNGLGVLPALAAKWEYGTPLVVTEHGMYMREHYLHSRQDPYRWPVKHFHLQLLRRLCVLGYDEATVITPGNVYNKRWEEQLGAEASRIRTVYNGVDPADFPALEDEPDDPVISWAGRIDPVKDLETLLRAFALIRAELPKARLRIFGSPPQGREAYLAGCEELSAELGLADAVTFEGRVARITDAYAAGQLVVLCSISEGFPYTLIEAMTCGRPCVATDVGGVTEAAGDTGLVVPPRHPAELAQACLTLLRDRELRKRLGDAARLRALEYFTVDRAISAFDEIYMFLGTGRPLPTPQPAGAGPLDAVPAGRQGGLAVAGPPAGRRLSVVREPGQPGQDIAGQRRQDVGERDERDARQTREETA